MGSRHGQALSSQYMVHLWRQRKAVHVLFIDELDTIQEPSATRAVGG